MRRLVGPRAPHPVVNQKRAANEHAMCLSRWASCVCVGCRPALQEAARGRKVLRCEHLSAAPAPLGASGGAGVGSMNRFRP